MERAALPPLIILAVATATAFLFAPVRIQLLRLLRRTRWLMAVLLLTYAYALPGTPLWPGWIGRAPASKALQQGALRVGRLLLMLAGLAVLLAYTSRPRLIYGLYALARPLTWLGFDRRAFAVRLGLTLDYVEHAPKAGALAGCAARAAARRRDARPPTPCMPSAGKAATAPSYSRACFCCGSYWHETGLK